MRFWAKIWKDNHMVRDASVTIDDDDTRTHKVFRALDEVCLIFDLERPIWLETNIREFRRHSSVRFRRDSFIEEIGFDCLEFMVLEEDQD